MIDINRHCLNVSRLAVIIGIELKMSAQDLKILSIAGLYHDIGKSKINNKILNKRSKLSNIEKELIKCHPYFSADILKKMNVSEDVIDAALYHHERWDGHGYPKEIKGTSIPIYSRIIAVADSYDAMTHDRPYSRAISHDEAIKELYACSGTQFDPNVVKAFSNLTENEFHDNIMGYA